LRLWDVRNGEVFRGEKSNGRVIISRIYDDLVIWHKRLKNDTLVSSLNDWCGFLLSCNATTNSG
jgi:hypothetical protein